MNDPTPDRTGPRAIFAASMAVIGVGTLAVSSIVTLWQAYAIFGVLIMLLVETAMITPPVGINLYVVQGVRGRGQLHDVMIGAAPFVVALLAMIALLVVVPDLALWLPQTLSR